ncbi:hypothetical protein L210DRAFT_3502710 [Boletus edulis BED1]|uniref:Uncharacterized protein n=1 Tax=Boletus edulis BED1 TaxID=1328754 RepID=A0AAD4BZ96_BOLED|nr:hypothetical protein L210DRAFT_3502710 [Boletus edulis BED1]
MLSPSCVSRTLGNFIQIAVPLKHSEETYHFTCNPDFPGPMTIEIVSSRVRVTQNVLMVNTSAPKTPVIMNPNPIPTPGSFKTQNVPRKEELIHGGPSGNTSKKQEPSPLSAGPLTAFVNKGKKRALEYDSSPTESDDDEFPPPKIRASVSITDNKENLVNKQSFKYEKPTATRSGFNK